MCGVYTDKEFRIIQINHSVRINDGLWEFLLSPFILDIWIVLNRVWDVFKCFSCLLLCHVVV